MFPMGAQRYLPRPLLSSKTPLFNFLHSPQLFCLFYYKNLDTSSMSSSKHFSSAHQSSIDIDEEPHVISAGNKASPVSIEEWQGWGTISPVPSMVNQVIRDLIRLEKDIDAKLTFGTNHGRLTGEFKVQEDKKHREKYATLGTSEEKTQYYSARQIACRLIGSRGYLCQKCWLAQEDCMCSRILTCSLWHQMRFWLYMHPKEFLRQNNTGKVLWQVFGVHAATLSLFGINEHEEMMWNDLKRSGRNKVWCLYPNKNAPTESVKDGVGQYFSGDIESHIENSDDTLHFILIDGTWSNSAAMFRRLQDQAQLAWGECLRCISLNTGLSSMHKLRPQPSWDRTCTAAAATSLLDELHLVVPELNSIELDKQAESIEKNLGVLLDALTNRRLRMGRSISRTVKYKVTSP